MSKGNVVRFKPRRTKKAATSSGEPAVIIILPVVRIERYTTDDPKPRKRGVTR